MKIGTLMTGVAVIAMAAAASAQAAENDNKDSNVERPNLVVAQLANPSGGSLSNAELAARIQALEDAQMNQSERAAADRTRLSTLEQGYNSAVWAFDNGRPTFASGDGRFTMAIRTRFQTDFGSFSQDSTHGPGFAGPADLGSGAAVRRAYFGVEGKAYKDFAYEFRMNLGGSGVEGASLSKAVVSYTGIPNWHFNAGIIEPAFMFEGTTSSGNLMFLERPEIDNIAADLFGASDGRRGLEVGWAKTDALWAGDNLNASVFFTGGTVGSSAGHGNGGDEQTQLLGRFADRVWSDGLSNISVGMSIAHVFNTGGGVNSATLQERPQIRVDGTRLISTGAVAAKTADMIAFDLGGNIDNFFLGGEWSKFTLDRQCGAITAAGNARCLTTRDVIDHPSFEGWYVEGSWIITGETRAYTTNSLNNETGGFQAPVPSQPFSLSGDSWGAWELVARYSDTDLNWNSNQLQTTSQLAGVPGGQERIFDVGVNWYMNRNIKLQLHDSFITVEKGTAAIPNRDGQDINVLGVRLQYSN